MDDTRLRSQLTTNKTPRFNKKSFFYTMLGFIQSNLSLLNDPLVGYIQKIAGTSKSEKHFNVTRIDKIHINCDCINGSFVNSVRERILFGFALDEPPGLKNYKTLRIELFKEINKTLFCLKSHSI